MKKQAIAILLISILLMSCQQQKKDVAVSDDIPSPEEMIKPFFADNYPVTDKMFGKGTSKRTFVTAHLSSENTVWFTNDSLKQTLMFTLFNDNSRLVSMCYMNEDIPNEIILNEDLRDEKLYVAENEDKLLYFKEFAAKAKKIKATYFTSNKGFRLGDPKEKAIKLYGKPDSVKTIDGYEKYYWNPAGAQITKQPVAEKDLLLLDEKKHFIRMYFKNNKLVTLIFDNVGRYKEYPLKDNSN